MKPPFLLPSTAEIRAVPWNGLTHVSTFSGCGGTCLGFRMAGFKTLLANDSDRHARECYEKNLGTPIDGGDIRQLTADGILSQAGLKAGELDVFEGSPPCTNFSTAGKGAKGWNKTKRHAGIVQSDTEKLFLAWLDLLDGLRPRAFAAENVTGLIKGASKGYFREILARMRALGYRVEARVRRRSLITALLVLIWAPPHTVRGPDLAAFDPEDEVVTRPPTGVGSGSGTFDSPVSSARFSDRGMP